MRTLIAGGPRVGKTTISRTLAREFGLDPRTTDELIGKVDFHQAPDEVAAWLETPGPWVIEGVHAVRALRVWLNNHAEGLPFDRLFWSDVAKVERTKGQEACAKGCNTVFSKIHESLMMRGAVVQRF